MIDALEFPIAAFEDGMIKRIADASAANVAGSNPPVPLLGYRLREITTYKGQLSAPPARMAEVIRVLPAVWVCFETATYDESMGLWVGRFTAVCMAQDARNERAERHSVGGTPGCYQVGKDVAGLIDGHRFGVPGCTAMRCTTFDVPFSMLSDQIRAAATVLTFNVSWDPLQLGGPAGQVPRNPAEAEGNFDTFDVGWDIPPFTVPTPAPPAEGVPNTLKAEDTITDLAPDPPQGG